MILLAISLSFLSVYNLSIYLYLSVLYDLPLICQSPPLPTSQLHDWISDGHVGQAEPGRVLLTGLMWTQRGEKAS